MSWGCLNEHQRENPCRVPSILSVPTCFGVTTFPATTSRPGYWNFTWQMTMCHDGMLQTMHSNWRVISHACKWGGRAKSVYVLPDPWSWMMDTSGTYARSSNTKHRTVIPLFDWVGCSKMFQDIPIKYCLMWTLAWDSTKFTKSRDARNWWAIPIGKVGSVSVKCCPSRSVPVAGAFRINSACSARLLLEACKVNTWKRFLLTMNWMHAVSHFPWTSSVFNDGSRNSHWFTSHKPNASRKSTSMPASMRREIQKAGKESKLTKHCTIKFQIMSHYLTASWSRFSTDGLNCQVAFVAKSARLANMFETKCH